jgi:hypothetical protein
MQIHRTARRYPQAEPVACLRLHEVIEHRTGQTGITEQRI